MALPTTRAQLKSLILRQLGIPVLDEIHVSDEQVEDNIDLALAYYADYHYDGSQKTYYHYQISDADRANKYITIPDNIIGVSEIFPIGDSAGVSNLFDIRYQIVLNDLYSLTNISLVPYYQTMQYVQMIQQVLVGRIPIRYTRSTNRIYIESDF